jgi:cytochrome c oxidase subunit 2
MLLKWLTVVWMSDARASTLPLQATDVARSWDQLYFFMVWLSVFFFVLVVGGMIYFAVKYRKSVAKSTQYITDNHVIEVIWTVIPAVLLMVIFGWGYAVYVKMTQAPVDAYEVRVIGKQWLWQFQYDDGRTTINELYVPVNKPVKLIMTSEDVIHSFFIPNFRVKQDVVPQMYSSVWFQATIPGKHQVFCTEYCGGSHSQMLAKVVVLDDQQWLSWRMGRKIDLNSLPTAGVGDDALAAAVQKQDEQKAAAAMAAAGKPTAQLTGLAAEGKALMQAKGCIACHSFDGSPMTGPTLKGVFEHEVELVDGKKVVADENYLRESIENPNAKVVKGFNPIMPTFKGLISETELNSVIAYIKTLKE